ncbi:fibronectin type III domain-containing protein [Paenibacillus sp. FSL H7-0331]|uniref:fibronectin type III domain-containing protein n=1 Tax=Paenibacillus sp. FSL H7-0331 TaxID=1920421 RepID=UPI00096DAD37|nr:fibronectin type III domain-containing protein [Paenibacillus sp. FSL H7-0331]OMF08405.1 hypothetical protein BK127_28790 [Paenibacillus sp. FSL H7-0331]
MKFDFTGTKLNIRTWLASGNSYNLKIDNIDKGSFSGNNTATYGVSYVDSSMYDGRHSVEITTTSSTLYVDTIDISSTGQILPFTGITALPSVPLNLAAQALDGGIELSWGTVTGATGYSLKRSTTAGGPYSTVASNVYVSPYSDTSVTNGTTYYYVVTALNAFGESVISNEASATPMGSKRVILTTTMTNGDTFEYNLSKTELTTFLNWYDTKAAVAGPVKYTFTNQHLKGSFLARKNSLIFDKIIKFKYDEYSVSGIGTPTEVAEVTAGTALSITLTDGKVEEFILSAADYNAFVAWHDAKSAGTGPARYTFENPLKKGPFIARHEVVIFDKISSYDSEDFN